MSAVASEREAVVDGPSCASGHCITCADEGVPMTVVDVDRGAGLAVCADERERRSMVEIALVAPVGPGSRLLVHAGTAIARLEEGAA